MATTMKIRPTQTWVERYLKFLRTEVKKPGLAALRELTRAQMSRVVFENISTILRAYREGTHPAPPDPEAVLENWIARRGGGLCYEIAPTFSALLQALGYRVTPVAGTITWRDSHQAAVVELEEGKWLVEVGNGAPFFRTIAVDQTTELSHCGLEYRFRPATGHLIQDRWDKEQGWKPFCDLELEAADAERLYAAYCRHHTPGIGKFVGELTMVACTADRVTVLHNLTLTEYRPEGKTRLSLSLAELPSVAQSRFGLPNIPILEAVSALQAFGVKLTAG